VPTPDFIRTLRADIGHACLYLPGVSVVVFDDAGRVLLGRRSDTGRWALIAGIPEPGEQPAETAEREVYEETGVRCVIERLVLVETLPRTTYPNGDVCQYTDITFRARAVGGTACVNDDESLAVDWFALDNLPELSAGAHFRLERAGLDEPAWFHAPVTS
jgi:8-oxo-dGTP pyrophosphatase MutT (NUDIX family)